MAIETTKICGGVPSLENDEIVISALMDRGMTLEAARNYCLLGCVEPGGTGDDWPACGGTGAESYMNLVAILWLALNNGINPMPPQLAGFMMTCEGQTGPATGYLYEMATFDDVLAAFKKQTEFFVRWHAGNVNSFEYVSRQNLSLPVVSCTVEGCMESGKDVMEGGARFNSTDIAGIGIGNVGDSLQMIKRLCFDEKKCSTRELYDALANGWEGHEELHSYIRNECPHYGNGIEECDVWAGWAADVFADAVNSCTGPCGRFSAGLYPVTAHISFGAITAATPDGRHKGEPLADGISPLQNMDKNGPTALLDSISHTHQDKYPNGTLLNMKFHPSSVAGDVGLDELVKLIEMYFFELGGMEMQINVVAADTLRSAQRDPEEYKNLVVCIAGFSVYFVEMHKPGQDDLISRTEIEIG